MSAARDHAVCARFDERPYEFRAVTDRRGWVDLVDAVLMPPPADSPWWVRGHRTISVGDVRDPREGSILLLVAVAARIGSVREGAARWGGAAYYRDMPNGTVRGWVTRNVEPIPDAPVLSFSAQGGTSFTADAVLDLDDLRRIVGEFVETGQRSGGVAWRESDWLQ